MKNSPLDQPQKDGAIELSRENLRMKSIKRKLEKSKKKVKRTQITLLILAGISVISGIYEVYHSMNEEAFVFWLIVGIDAFIIASYLVAGIFVKKNPVVWTIFALCVFSVIHLLSAILEPASIIQGLLLKIVVFVFLINGLIDALGAKKLRKELELEELQLLQEERSTV